MNCPLCAADTRVLYTEGADRRRACAECQHRFTTTEILKTDHQRSQAIIDDAKALAEKLTAGA